jgi:hypothetical protein
VRWREGLTGLASSAYRVNAGKVAQETVRGFIDLLTEVAGTLPEGLDSAIELGICDGKTLQIIDNVEVDFWVQVAGDGSRIGAQCVLICGHQHRRESTGREGRSVAANLDEELRKLSGG